MADINTHLSTEQKHNTNLFTTGSVKKFSLAPIAEDKRYTPKYSAELTAMLVTGSNAYRQNKDLRQAEKDREEAERASKVSLDIVKAQQDLNKRLSEMSRTDGTISQNAYNDYETYVNQTLENSGLSDKYLKQINAQHVNYSGYHLGKIGERLINQDNKEISDIIQYSLAGVTDITDKAQMIDFINGVNTHAKEVAKYLDPDVVEKLVMGGVVNNFINTITEAGVNNITPENVRELSKTLKEVMTGFNPRLVSSDEYKQATAKLKQVTDMVDKGVQEAYGLAYNGMLYTNEQQQKESKRFVDLGLIRQETKASQDALYRIKMSQEKVAVNNTDYKAILERPIVLFDENGKIREDAMQDFMHNGQQLIAAGKLSKYQFESDLYDIALASADIINKASYATATPLARKFMEKNEMNQAQDAMRRGNYGVALPIYNKYLGEKKTEGVIGDTFFSNLSGTTKIEFKDGAKDVPVFFTEMKRLDTAIAQNPDILGMMSPEQSAIYLGSQILLKRPTETDVGSDLKTVTAFIDNIKRSGGKAPASKMSRDLKDVLDNSPFITPKVAESINLFRAAGIPDSDVLAMVEKLEDANKLSNNIFIPKSLVTNTKYNVTEKQLVSDLQSIMNNYQKQNPSLKNLQVRYSIDNVLGIYQGNHMWTSIGTLDSLLQARSDVNNNSENKVHMIDTFRKMVYRYPPHVLQELIKNLPVNNFSETELDYTAMKEYISSTEYFDKSNVLVNKPTKKEQEENFRLLKEKGLNVQLKSRAEDVGIYHSGDVRGIDLIKKGLFID